MENCIICEKKLPARSNKKVCNTCKKRQKLQWLKKNIPWVLAVLGFILFILYQLLNDSRKIEAEGLDLDDNIEDDSDNDLIKGSGEKYWNSKTSNWEVNGKPYTYRVSYIDTRDNKVHALDYKDVDNGYEDYEYYKKRWYTSEVSWEHVPPEES